MTECTEAVVYAAADEAALAHGGAEPEEAAEAEKTAEKGSSDGADHDAAESVCSKRTDQSRASRGRHDAARAG